MSTRAVVFALLVLCMNAAFSHAKVYKVMLKSATGSCLAIYDGSNNSRPYGWRCNKKDSRQIWYYNDSTLSLNSAMGSCLAIYDGKNNSKPYGWGCIKTDRRQKWYYSRTKSGRTTLKSAMGSCLAIYDGNNDSKAYGWKCIDEARQWWTLVSV